MVAAFSNLIQRACSLRKIKLTLLILSDRSELNWA